MIEDMIRPYYIDLEMSDLSEVTVRDYISGISSFLSYLDEAKITPKFENVSETVVAQYLRHLHNKGNSNATIVKCFLQVKIPHFCRTFSPGTGGEFLC